MIFKQLVVGAVISASLLSCGQGESNTATTARIIATDNAPEPIATELERLYALSRSQLTEVEDMVRRKELYNPSIDWSVNRLSSLDPGEVQDYYRSMEQLILFAKQYPDFVKPSVLSHLLAFGDALDRCLPDCAYEPS